MLDKIMEVIQENDVCVLATAGPEGPHTSFMAYACSMDARFIYLAASRASLKYRNLCAHPAVSLMIDTREKEARGKMRALSLKGDAKEIKDTAQADAVRSMLLLRHPQLHNLFEQPDLALIGVSIRTAQMLTGPLEAHYVKFPEESRSSPATR